MVPVLLFTLIGLGLAIGYTSVSSRTHFTSSHAILGIVFILLALFQGTLGFYIHAKRVPSGELRPARNWGHRLFGLVVFILGIATLILGYIRYAALYGLSRDGIAPYLGAAIGWVILWFVAGEAWRVSESLRARRESRTDSQREIKDDFDVSVDGGDIKETVDWHQVVANREKLAA